MIHLNGNVICAIDVETSGLKAGHHEIVQVCFLPLDSQLKPRKDVVPFDLNLKVEFEDRIDWDAYRVTKINFFKHQQSALDKWTAADLFEDWMEKLKLPERKRISPLAHNWPFDRAFIFDWLGYESANLWIDGRYRDTMALALGINDIADINNEPIPFPKVKLSYIAAQLKIPHERAHTALGDCIVTAEVYRKLLRKSLIDQGVM